MLKDPGRPATFNDRAGRARDHLGRFAVPNPEIKAPAEFRITVFGEPRGPWRSSRAAAMRDAIAAELASWNEERREHYLAVPVAMVSRVRR